MSDTFDPAVPKITILTGVTLPVSVHDPLESRAIYSILISNGLGATDPKAKDHINDEWIQIIAQGAVISNTRSVMYTARGHGSSTGWESTAETNPQQFTWFNLADDMLSVANYYELPKFIVSGSSMGAATSLWTAIKYPERVAAVIMLRPPTAWDSRAARASVKEGAVRNVLELHPNEMFHKVVAGVSMSDLPPLEDPSVYANITCPVLLLAVSNSKTHPLSSAEKLLELLPNAQLHVCKNEKEASKVWPQVVADFLNTVQSTC